MGPGEPGNVLAGRYRLRSVIGQGGMGAVWLAEDELLGREVAVKEIHWPYQLDPAERENLRARALREARTAARLDHPNIVRVYDVVEADGRPWIVMQLVPYRSLSDAIKTDGPLEPARAAAVGLEILDAIRAAHAVGVLHRDVKPGNVLFGPEDQVVLTDFGMAIADGSPTLTSSGILIGSPAYMAPERARGEPATPAADLWSLGATLYTAVEGRPPFDREGALAVLTAVVSGYPDPPRRAGPLWPVISALLHKNAAERASSAEAERLLRRVASGHAVPGGAQRDSTAPLAAVVPLGGTRPGRADHPGGAGEGHTAATGTGPPHGTGPADSTGPAGSTGPPGGSGSPGGAGRGARRPVPASRPAAFDELVATRPQQAADGDGARQASAAAASAAATGAAVVGAAVAGAAETSAAEESPAEESAAEADAAEASVAEADAAETSISEANTAEADEAETGAAETGAAETGAAETSISEANTAEADEAEAGAAQASTAEPSPAEAGAAEMSGAEASAAETREADADAALASTAEASAAEAGAAEMSGAEADRLEADRLEADRLEADRLEAEAGEAREADADAGETSGAEVSGAEGSSVPGAAVPGAAGQDAAGDDGTVQGDAAGDGAWRDDGARDGAEEDAAVYGQAAGAHAGDSQAKETGAGHLQFVDAQFVDAQAGDAQAGDAQTGDAQAGDTRTSDAAGAGASGHPALIPGLERRPPVLARDEGWPAPPPSRTRARTESRRPRWLLAAAGAAAAAVIAVTAVILTQGGSPQQPASSRGRGASSAPGHHHPSPAARGGSHSPPAGQPTAGASPSASPGGSGPGGGGGSGSGPAPLPAGFTRHHDPTGFSIGVPDGWQVSHQGHLVYVRDPSGGRFLIIDQSDQPKPNPLADWQAQEAARIGTYPGYHRIRLESVHYAQAERAADWEFTYYQGGQLVHVLNRNILANAHHAYALYWSTPASEWHASYHYFRAFASTFRPAGGTPGG